MIAIGTALTAILPRHPAFNQPEGPFVPGGSTMRTCFETDDRTR